MSETTVGQSTQTVEGVEEVSAVPGEPTEPESAVSDEEPDSFPRAYVEELRAEAAANRVRAGRADAIEERLREVTTVAATLDLLHDPADLPWSDSMVDEEGFPDRQKIRDAAERLIVEKPWLAKVRGSDVGQGRVEEATGGFSLAGILRDRA